jgi:DNA mismatch repair protein MutS
LFATHYHEITQLADKHRGMKNFNVAVKETGDQITFLYKVVPGPADQSYGIQVADLAGLPKEVIKRARQIYKTLETVENDLGRQKRPASATKILSLPKHKKVLHKDQMGLFS